MFYISWIHLKKKLEMSCMASSRWIKRYFQLCWICFGAIFTLKHCTCTLYRSIFPLQWTICRMHRLLKRVWGLGMKNRSRANRGPLAQICCRQMKCNCFWHSSKPPQRLLSKYCHWMNVVSSVDWCISYMYLNCVTRYCPGASKWWSFDILTWRQKCTN